MEIILLQKINKLGNIGENKLLLIASITVMDEYFETKKKIDEQKNQVKEITDKFIELKSLVYDYKDSKEKEIFNLGQDQAKLINQLEAHKANYESLVDKTTSEIENFIKKQDIDTKVQ